MQEQVIPIVDQPLEVNIVDGEIVLTSPPEGTVALSKNAAIETGVRLINAGMEIKLDPKP